MAEPRSPLRVAFLTHEPFFPPSGGGSAEAVYLVEEMVRRGHEVHVFCPQIAEPESIEKKFRIHLHLFNKWQMGRYASLRNFKYLLFPLFLQRMVAEAARTTKFDLLLSQHAISAVAAGKLKKKLGVPVVMNFPDLLTGFMETWPGYIAPRPFVRRSNAMKFTCRNVMAWTGCWPFLTHWPIISPGVVIRVKRFSRFISVTRRNISRFVSEHREKAARR